MIVTVPASHYLAVAGAAARHLGATSMRHLAQTGRIVHEELVSDLLAEARLAHPSLAGAVVREYVRALRTEAKHRGLDCPSPVELIQSFERAGDRRFGGADLSHLVASALSGKTVLESGPDCAP